MLLRHRQWFPVIYLGGPRQSGKTTLLRRLFPDLPYANLENPESQLTAVDDPQKFLGRFPHGGILDEAQRVPHLFSYLQGIVDEDKTKQFFLSCSQNFLLMESITQSLAGRVGILNLYPFSYVERQQTGEQTLKEFLFKGGFPALYERNTPHNIFFNNYIKTYLERDVRTLKNVGSLTEFARFLKLCAGRVGQPLNMSALATDAGISVNTVKSWLSVLEASYFLFFLHPYHVNFNKRITKAPKIYFFDTGVLCFLLGLTSEDQLENYHFAGNIFENAIISELYKKRTNYARQPVFWFWQDQHGNEIDLLIEEDLKLKAIEIKSSQTYNSRLTSGLKLWQKIAGSQPENQFLVYAGEMEAELEHGRLLPWRKGLALL
ncbi:MAG: ATP-binding protein [Bacteroidia bacterium]